MPIDILEGGLDDPRVIALLQHHLTLARAVTPAGSAHALELSGLREATVTFWSTWEGDARDPLVGVGALHRLSATHGELKSMHTAVSARRRGVATAILDHIIEYARTAGMTRLSLETGTTPYFAAARKLYVHHGFEECAPFGAYRPDPNNVFMTLPLAPDTVEP